MDARRLEEFKILFNEMKRINELEKYKLDQLAAQDNSGDEIDLSIKQRDEQLQLKLHGRQNFFMKKIDAALARIEAGSFGECEECAEEIGIKRLRARPTAELCINCKEELERKEENVAYLKRSHTHGREIINQNLEAVKSLVSGEILEQRVLPEKMLLGRSVN
ncbi:TraR/DksA C4-type zinc finger protein [Halobacteriovorax sp. HLS]|uniref:TraR/DksA family transcriptional regulator n=1 Tax=Halobacteriovorax sp. HLS TaxID=2234000 RepID=UPI000FD94AA0|nr:TraR/DksA C4-type zinc finger protein [Halobacteriovorax sp. HLS]